MAAEPAPLLSTLVQKCLPSQTSPRCRTAPFEAAGAVGRPHTWHGSCFPSCLPPLLALQEIKSNATEIIKAGAALYDALGQEPELREHRARAVAGHVDTDFVERSIREAIAQVGR
jgi:hypothetical protein